MNPEAVVVSAAISEIRPTSFDVSVRLRALSDGRDTPLDVCQRVDLVDRDGGGPLPVGDGIRDELIALAHSAQHLN